VVVSSTSSATVASASASCVSEVRLAISSLSVRAVLS
jgi:hypothetical protein